MKLDDFEYYFDEKVLERGRELFNCNKVIPTDRYGANWYFQVKGSKIYRVVICLHKNMNINFERCNCPYAERNLCKHIAACLFYIRKELNISKETMLSKFLKKNSEIVETNDLVIIAKKFFQSVFRKIRKQGFIEYQYMTDFEIAINEFLEYLNEHVQKVDKVELFKACLYLINIISSTKYNCDDSNGEIVRSFYSVENFIKGNIFESNNTLFSILFTDITNSKNEYDFELYGLLELACQFAQTDIDKQKIKKHINNLIQNTACADHFIKIKDKYFK